MNGRSTAAGTISAYGKADIAAGARNATSGSRNQIQAVTEQTKQLVEYAQKAVLATAEPLKMGVTKAFNHVT